MINKYWISFYFPRIRGDQFLADGLCSFSNGRITGVHKGPGPEDVYVSIYEGLSGTTKMFKAGVGQ